MGVNLGLHSSQLVLSGPAGVYLEKVVMEHPTLRYGSFVH